MDDVPTINLARGECGSVTNPHVVASPSSLVCLECDADLAALLLDRARAALGPREEASSG
jgi:hypothetical protein